MIYIICNHFVCELIVSTQTIAKKVAETEPRQEIIKLNKDISIITDKYLDARAEKFGLTAAQGIILLCISQSGGIMVSELNEIVDISKSTVSSTLKRLCGKGFITLETLESDNRQKRIVPTEKALRVKNGLLREFDCAAGEIFAGVSQSELEFVLKMQRAVLKNAHRSLKNYMETEESY